MDVTPLVPADRQLIESYADGEFRVSGVVYTGAVLVFPDRSQLWDVGDFSGLTARSFQPVVAHRPGVELLLLGCGAKMALVPSRLRQALRDDGIVVEAMDTGAACRTYNVLLAEGRRVAAALFPA